jgi:hypothetical protein
MKPIHVYQLSVYLKDDSEELNAIEIQEAIQTELDGTYYLNVFDIKWQGVIRTDIIEHDEGIGE